MTSVMIALPPREVHLALTELGDELPTAETERFLGLLEPSERARHDRLIVEEPRRQYLVTRALVKTELSRYAPVVPEDWRFKTNKHGRPELAEHAEESWLRFNLSNTHGLIACALARGADIGVDVEDTLRKTATVEVADRFFSPHEVADLHALPTARQRDRFFDYWTLKEAYIKARGMGLAIPLDKFTFRIVDGQPVRIEIDSSLGDDASTWQFWLDRSLPRHRMAIAVRRGKGPDFALRTRQVSTSEL